MLTETRRPMLDSDRARIHSAITDLEQGPRLHLSGTKKCFYAVGLLIAPLHLLLAVWLNSFGEPFWACSTPITAVLFALAAMSLLADRFFRVPRAVRLRERDALVAAANAGQVHEWHVVADSVVEICPFDDEPPIWIFDTGDGRSVVVSGFWDTDLERPWPTTEFRVSVIPGVGVWGDLEPGSTPIRPSQVVSSEDLDAEGVLALAEPQVLPYSPAELLRRLAKPT